MDIWIAKYSQMTSLNDIMNMDMKVQRSCHVSTFIHMYSIYKASNNTHNQCMYNVGGAPTPTPPIQDDCYRWRSFGDRSHLKIK